MVLSNGEYQSLQKSYDTFALAHTVSDILMFEMCDLENLWQCYTGEKLDVRLSVLTVEKG